MTNYNIQNEQSLITLFSSLEPVSELSGVYSPEIPGPPQLKPLKKLFLHLTGLPGWAGKHFFEDYALNIIRRKNKTVQGPQMSLSVAPSVMDQKQGLVATYGSDAPFIWRRCTDEFRVLNSNSILGMSHFDLPGFRNKRVMFLLHKVIE